MHNMFFRSFDLGLCPELEGKRRQMGRGGRDIVLIHIGVLWVDSGER